MEKIKARKNNTGSNEAAAPLRKIREGVYLFSPTSNRDKIGVDVFMGREFVVVSSREKRTWVLGEFEGKGIAKDPIARGEKNIVLHRFGGISQFHKFAPLPENKLKEIEREFNKKMPGDYQLGARD